MRRVIAGVALIAALHDSGAAMAREKPRPLLIVDDRGESPVELYDQGVALLARGDDKEAEKVFRRSMSLARRSGIDFAPPHEGLGRVLLKRGKLAEAYLEADHAAELDPAWSAAFWVLGQIAEREKNDEMALVRYQQGLGRDPNNSEIRAAAAALLHRMGREREASEVESAMPRPRPRPSGGAPAPADSAASAPFEAARERLRPFFPENSAQLGNPILAVMSGPLLTRGALAVLLTADGRHSLARGLESSMADLDNSGRPPEDVDGRPEEGYIVRALMLGVLETLPDGLFHPDDPVTRQALALWVEETIARLQHRDDVFRLYRGEPSPFPDLPDGHYALNAARVAIDLGLIRQVDGGRFAPDRPLTMDEGIGAVLRLVPALAGRSGE